MNETTETQRSQHGNSLIITAASFVNYWYFHLFLLQKLHKQKKNLERKKALHRFLKPSVTSVSLWFWLIHRPKLKNKMCIVTKDTGLSSTWFIFDRNSFTPDLLDCVRYIHVGLHGAVGDKNQRWTNDIFSRVTLFSFNVVFPCRLKWGISMLVRYCYKIQTNSKWLRLPGWRHSLSFRIEYMFIVIETQSYCVLQKELHTLRFHWRDTWSWTVQRKQLLHHQLSDFLLKPEICEFTYSQQHTLHTVTVAAASWNSGGRVKHNNNT